MPQFQEKPSPGQMVAFWRNWFGKTKNWKNGIQPRFREGLYKPRLWLRIPANIKQRGDGDTDDGKG